MDKNKKVSFDIIVYSMMIVAVIYAIVQSLSGHNNEMEQMDDLEDAAALQGIAHVPARVKCAVLAWHTLEEALDGEGKVK